MSTAPFRTAQEEQSVFEQAHAWVVLLAGGEAGAAEIAALQDWLAADPRHRAAFEEARATWQMSDALADDFAAGDFAPGEVLHAGDGADVLPFERRRRRRRVVAAVSSLAAVLALLAVFADDVVLRASADYRTEVGAIRSVDLPDGSRVTLNTDSAIAVDFSSDERRVDLLRGEALFEVQADTARPFRVSALGGATQAVGTAFTVRQAESDVSVAVSEGTVRLTSPARSAEGVFLSAGERGGYGKGAGPSERGTVAVDSIAPWRGGRIVFEGRPFEEAVDDLDRYYPGTIITLRGAGRGRPVSAVFSLDALDGAIAALAETQGLTVFRITDYLVILR